MGGILRIRRQRGAANLARRGWRRGSAGAIATSVIAIVLLSPTPARGQGERNAIAEWRNGKGNCGDFNGTGGGGNGTGGFPGPYDFATSVELDGFDLRITSYAAGGRPFWAEMTGRLRDDGTFELRARNASADEDYEFNGRVDGERISGTYVRHAHYVDGVAGPRCTSRWNVSMVVPGGLDVPIRTEGDGAEGDGAADEASGDIDLFSFLPLLGIALAAVGGVWFFLGHGKTKEKPKEEEPEKEPEHDEFVEPLSESQVGEPVGAAPPPKASEEPSCECSGSIVIRGRNRLRVCECLNLNWEVARFSTGPGSGIAQGSVRYNTAILRGLFPDGDLFCARLYSPAQIIGECTGGGSMPNPSHLNDVSWEAKKGPGPDELTLRCSARAEVLCPKDGLSWQRFEGEMTIKLEKVECEVSIVINQDSYFERESGHAGVRIRCGEYDAIFGYFPEDPAWMQLASLKGGSRVLEVTSRDDTQSDSLTLYYRDIVRREYVFKAACRDCERLRRRWNDLANNPGQFELYYNNCTSVTVELVSGIVQLPDKLAENFFGFGLKSPAKLNRLLGEAKLTPIVHAVGVPIAPPDH